LPYLKNPMLSKEEANAIADTLLDEARAARPRRSEPVPLLYRCRALRALPNELQSEVVREARKKVATNGWFLGAMLLWFAALAALLITRHGFLDTSGFAPMVTTLCWLVPLTVQGALVRRNATSIATRLAEASLNDSRTAAPPSPAAATAP
jgi:hypothetical protein